MFNYGDVSTCSFHATKVFHTGEGGCFISQTEELQKKLYFRHNFGHNGRYHFEAAGINAKMSELQAAMGLAVLDCMEEIASKRKASADFYYENWTETDPNLLQIRPETEWNYAYFPILFENEKILLETVKRMEKENIYPRRYYYPSLNTLPFYDSTSTMPVSEDIAARILCLPISSEISRKDQENILKILRNH